MDENFKRALKSVRQDIINDFDPSYLWNEVLENNDLTEKIKNDMKSSSANDFEERRRFWVQKLLAILPTRENAAFSMFVRNIRGCGQEYLAAALEEQAKCLSEIKTPIQKTRSEYEDINMDEFLGLNSVLPKKLFSNRIRICDVKKSSKDQIGIIQFQIIHKMIKRGTKLGTLYSFFIADDSGGINLIAEEKHGKALDLTLKLKSFWQLSTWRLLPRKRDIISLSNHGFELWIDQLPSVSSIPCIPDTRPIIPLNDIMLTKVDQIPFLSKEGNIDVVACVHKVYSKQKTEKGHKKLVELRNSNSKTKYITVQCHLFDDNVDFIKKQDVVVVIKSAIVKRSSGGNCLWVGSQSAIFLINESFDETWIRADQRELINALKPKSKQRMSNNLTTEIEDASNRNSEPGRHQNASGPNGLTLQNSGSRETTTANASILSSSATNSKNGQTPRRGAKRKISFLDVDKKLKSKKLSNLEPTLVSDVKIVKAKIESYEGCPDDNCVKKANDCSTPYLCTGFRCKGSPMKKETKCRYKLQCVLCSNEAPQISKDVTVFDKMARKLFDLVTVNPAVTSNDRIVEKLKSSTFDVDISGKRNGEAWDLTVQNVELSG